jgi:glycosyltransferase involved in cell wall biosynthesis
MSVNRFEIIIIRFPSLYGLAFIIGLKLRKIPFNLEVVADAEFAYTSVKPIQKCLYFIQKYLISKAKEVSYVTKNHLQKKYPHYSLINYNYSSTTIDNDYFYKKPQSVVGSSPNSRTLLLLNVSGHIKNKQKGHDTIIKIASYLISRNLDFKITLVGEGKYLSKIKKKIVENNLSQNFDIKGHLNKSQIKTLYRESDIFIYTSKSEGLPRVIIEAMANSLLCISTKAGGITELIDDDLIFNFYDYKRMGNKIIEFANNPSKMFFYESHNYNKAKEYLPSKLKAMRKTFFEKLVSNSHDIQVDKSNL